MSSNGESREPPAFAESEPQAGGGATARIVRGVFDSVAPRYDRMNDLMSLGAHRLWKASLIDSLAPRPGTHLLDLAGGTGDIAFRFLEAIQGQGAVTLVDPNPEMLAEGERRASRYRYADRIAWICAGGEALPLEPRSVDACSIAFGVRNVADHDAVLSEIYRVLRFGARFVCLEFCPRPAVAGLDRLYERYSRRVIPLLGRWVAGDAESYRYLVESIRRFPEPDAFAERVRAAGFARVSYRLLSGGICAIHSGWKL